MYFFPNDNFFRILSSTVLLYSAISGKLINLEEDELEFYIGEEDTYDDSNYTFFAELKSAENDKHAGGIKVRNMGRIMKMSMFLQKKLPKEFIRQFKRYGCHCWPRGRTILGGQGKPVDEIDRTCKRLFNCHRCLTINSENECNPLDFTYKVRGKDTNGSRKLHCDGNAEGTCQRKLCECDLSFAMELSAEMQSMAYTDGHSKWKGFNSADECHSQDFLNARSKLVPTEMPVPEDLPTYKGWACCGEEYKNFMPYRPSKGSRCCNNGSNFATYVLMKQDCCPDGSVRPLGQCA